MNCATATERQRTVRAVNVSDIKISVVHFEPTSKNGRSVQIILVIPTKKVYN